MTRLRVSLFASIFAACSGSPAGPTTDGAVNDVPSSIDAAGTDAARADAPAPTDAPAAMDVPRLDGTVTTDTPASTDTPAATDTPVARDAPASSDSPVATDGPAATDACARPEVVRLTARVDCGPRSDGATCPTGYTCMSFSGIVLQQYCGRACVTDCDCPSGERCGSYSDKAGMHPLCVDAAN